MVRENKHKYSINHNFFDIIDSEEKAYILGLWFADGSLHKNRYGVCAIELQEEDGYILDKIKNIIEYTGPFYFRKPRYNNKSTITLSFTSHNIYNNLIKLGCTPNKSLILKFPDNGIIPDLLLRHFIRGFFDGNGCIGYIIRKYNYHQIYFSVCSTTAFLDKLYNIFTEKFYYCGYIANKTTKNIGELRYGGKDIIIKILDWLYQDSSIYLLRKYNKYVYLKQHLQYNITDITTNSLVPSMQQDLSRP
jgi:hypothetical protein